MFILLLMFVCVLVLYLYFTKNQDYWLKRNVKYERPIPLFGNMYRNVVGARSITEIATEFYTKYPNEKVVGLYEGTTPVLIVRDIELIRRIMSTDFPYFYARGITRNPKYEPLFMNLFHADGDLWKLLRHRLTPAFTTAKLKRMFPLVLECSKKLQYLGEEIVNRGGECDVSELMARFTTEFIGACGFGLQFDSINNENALFREIGKYIFNRNRSWTNMALLILYDLIPDLRTPWQLFLSGTTVTKTMSELVRGVLNQRKHKPSGRHDFIDLLLEIEEKGKMKTESIEKRNADGSAVTIEKEMDFDCMVAQVFIFFAAGFETSSFATSCTLYHLALHPDEQKKIQNEIDEVLMKFDDKMNYESISEMTRLKMALKEALRLFPSAGILNRQCTRRYKIPELDITIDPGVKIIIPVQSIQNDEKYFKNPSEFKPDRFNNMSEMQDKFSYLPFGEGPRMCIGARLGEMQSLAGLAAVLHKFSLEPGPTTRRKLEVSHTSNIVQSIQGGIPLKLKLRTEVTK